MTNSEERQTKSKYLRIYSRLLSHASVELFDLKIAQNIKLV